MNDTFQEREKSFEAKFKMDEETKFRVEARRNKLIGLWAAEKMGLGEADADAYAKEVIDADMEELGHMDVVRKLMKDFADKGVEIAEEEVIKELEAKTAIAVEQVEKEFPMPLSTDHA